MTSGERNKMSDRFGRRVAAGGLKAVLERRRGQFRELE